MSNHGTSSFDLPDEDFNVVIRNEESQGALDLSRYERVIPMENLAEISEVEGVGCSLVDVAKGGEALGDATWIKFNLVLETVQGK
ncbi:hypothetical protein V6N13_024608 [Hibiscus sabdariffa]|uniref:Uncharacterized protein n=2 Tax=Hibiscus sabdariffa TaxID=183260 RepID=A0ABR1ZU11_9ROSI